MALGIDIECITHRGAQEQTWRDVSFHRSERQLVDQLPEDRQTDAYTTMWVSKEASAKALSAMGITTGLGAPKQWEVKRWVPITTEIPDMNGSPLHKLEIPVLASGICIVHYRERPEYSPVSQWWIFEREDQRWALSLVSLASIQNTDV